MNTFNDEIIKYENNKKIKKSYLKQKMDNKNLINNQNYIISSKMKKNISKKLLKLFSFWYIEEKKRLADSWIIYKVEVPLFSAKIIFFLVFMLFFLLLWYLLLTEYSDWVLFGFLFILLWWFLVFILPSFQRQFKVKVLFDKDKYLYYFYKEKYRNKKIRKEYFNWFIKISYDKK